MSRERRENKYEWPISRDRYVTTQDERCVDKNRYNYSSNSKYADRDNYNYRDRYTITNRYDYYGERNKREK